MKEDGYPYSIIKTDITKKSVINIGTKLYNNMPGFLKGMDNYETFKRELKLFLLYPVFTQ
jgi:hypothetical protein